MIKIAINGIGGRMGQELCRAIQKNDQFQLIGGIDTGETPVPPDLPVYSDPSEIITRADVMVDFSLPAGAMRILKSCREYGKPLVTGTTGLDEQQLQQFVRSGKKIPIVQAFNFSIGINLLLKVVRKTAGILGDNADIEIVESHHRLKKDAPSGTALLIARHLAEVLGRPFPQVIRSGRSGKELQRKTEIGIHSLRGGSVVGEHQVHFLGENENLIFTHQALNRRVFGDGALLAARWIMKKKPGLYSMQQVLDF